MVAVYQESAPSLSTLLFIIQTILYDCFTLSEVSAWWVPGECSQRHKNKCESSDVGRFWSSVVKMLRLYSKELLLEKIVQEGARSVHGVLGKKLRE